MIRVKMMLVGKDHEVCDYMLKVIANAVLLLADIDLFPVFKDSFAGLQVCCVENGGNNKSQRYKRNKEGQEFFNQGFHVNM